MEDKDDPGEIPILHIGVTEPGPGWELAEKIMLTIATMMILGACLLMIWAIAFGLYKMGGKAFGFILGFSVLFGISWKIREIIDRKFDV